MVVEGGMAGKGWPTCGCKEASIRILEWLLDLYQGNFVEIGIQ
jgi:hypothetical protein